MKKREIRSYDWFQSGNEITIEEGYLYVYGYVAYTPKTTIIFNRTSAKQYHIVYVELDKSVIPNVCAIKTKNNQGSNKIKETTLRQDYLTAIKTGVYQFPLLLVELSPNGIASVIDLRQIKKMIDYAKITKITTGKVTRLIDSGATGITQPVSDRSKKLATTEYVHLAVSDCINK